MASNTDQDWEFYGKTDPYYGVLTSDQFHSKNLDETSLSEFFETGKRHIDHIFEVIHTHVDPAFKPETALDFGCGVGRLLIPLAGKCIRVTGADVSASMLDEARENCARSGVSNVDLVQSDDTLSRLSGEFDLIHSVIVFQHIPRERGEKIVVRLIDLLAEGGVGALHFLYRRESSRVRRLISWLRKTIPLSNGVINLLLKQPFGTPFMQSNEYDLGVVFQILQRTNCQFAHVQFSIERTGHTLYYGATVFFKKGSQTVEAWRPEA